MASISIFPATGVVTLVPRWSIGGNLAGFHLMAQDLSLGGGANQFYSIKRTAIPAGGDIAAFTKYIAASGSATNHVDIGSKLTPDSYSAMTSADPDVGYGSVNIYFIHHKSSGDYFTVLVPGSATASAVTDLKPMSGPGGPATLGAAGYFGLTFAASNLGYGLNYFYYFRTDPVTGFTKFGTLDPALLGTSADKFDLGRGGHNALIFTGTDVGFGASKMYYLRLDPTTGFSILGTLNPGTGQASDIANLGSVYSTLDFVPGDVGFGSGRFYTTGASNTNWQSVSFAAIADRLMSAGSFTVSPSASSGLPVTLTVVAGSSGAATISGPVAGVFTVTPTAPGRITLQASQAGQVAPVAYEFNMLQQSFTVPGNGVADFNGDGYPDILWQSPVTGRLSLWLMNGTTTISSVDLGTVGANWKYVGNGDFNGDGKPDIVWLNTVTGVYGVWLMNGTTVSSFVTLGTTGLNWTISAIGDFNRDGSADLFWRNTATGALGIALMNGTTQTTFVSLGTTGSNWTVAGAGDFDADGNVDIVWLNTATGVYGVWLMNGTTVSSFVTLGTNGLNWTVASVGDYNRDGYADIVWQNKLTGSTGIALMKTSASLGGSSLGYADLGVSSDHTATGDFNKDGNTDLIWVDAQTGVFGLWLMNGVTEASSVQLGTTGLNWSIVGARSFNRDGQADIVWQNKQTGEVGLWLMNGTVNTGYVFLGNQGTDWAGATIGDINGDGYADVILQNKVTGEYGVWLMTGTAPASFVSLGTPGTNLSVVASGDFNGDGCADLVWQNKATGEFGLWLMNGTTTTGTVSLGFAGPNWNIAGTGDFNLDGQTDLIWQSKTSGQFGVWLMKGTVNNGYVPLGTTGINWIISNH